MSFFDTALQNLATSLNTAPLASSGAHTAPSLGNPLASLFPSRPPLVPAAKGEKATKKKQKPKKKKEPSYESDSGDNEGDLSFVDNNVDEKENPFVKAFTKKDRYYSASREKKKRRMISSSDDDEDGNEEEEEEDEAEEGDDSDHVFTRPDGSDLKYTRDEYVRFPTTLKEINERRKRLGKAELEKLDDDSDDSVFDPNAKVPASQEEEEGEEDGDEGDDDDDSDGSERDDSPLPFEEDEERMLIEDARHAIKVLPHRARSVPERQLTSRTAKAIEHERALVHKEVDSEADTVDNNNAPKEEEDDDDDEEEEEEDDEDGEGTNKAITHVQEYVAKVLANRLQVVDNNSDVGTFLELTSELYESIMTLSAIHLNASVMQQQSNNIQAHIKQGHSNIPGQSQTRTQCENAQEKLYFLDALMHKEKVLRILEDAQ